MRPRRCARGSSSGPWLCRAAPTCPRRRPAATTTTTASCSTRTSPATASSPAADVLPGQPRDRAPRDPVHASPPDQVAAAEAHDAQTAGRGWTCFGGTALPDRTTTARQRPGLRAVAGRLGARRRRERLRPRHRQAARRRAAGSCCRCTTTCGHGRGAGLDTPVRLRLAPGTAPPRGRCTRCCWSPRSSCPARPGESGLLCDRVAAVLDLTCAVRAGRRARRWPACSCCAAAASSHPRAGTDPALRPPGRPGHDGPRRWPGTCTCSAGRSRSTLNPGGPRERTLLDRPVWDFDNQGATPLRGRSPVRPGDTLRVTCTHDATLRSQLPELDGRAAALRHLGRGHDRRDVPGHRACTPTLIACGLGRQPRACQAASRSRSRSGASPASAGSGTVRVQASVSRTVSASGRGDSPVP